MQIKKSSFLRNKFFSAKNKAPMQKFLNEMSENALHINKIGSFSCSFTEDASIRYVYSICGEDEDILYTEKSGWEHFYTFKGVSFYRKLIPLDAVKLTRTYNKKQLHQEISWLNARLSEGLSLIAKIGNEYIFARDEEKKDYEYSIKHKQKRKKQKKNQEPEAYMPFGDTSGYTFICEGESNTYYFLKDEAVRHSVIEHRGKRLSDLLFSALVVTGSALGFCASLAAFFYSFIAIETFKIPLMIIGGIGTLACTITFFIFFKKFQRISEARKIRREEKRRAKVENIIEKPSEVPHSEQKITEPTGNTVVMNTVVMNNYGNSTEQGGAPQFTPSPMIPDGSVNPALDPSVNPAITVAQNPEEFARAVMNGIRYGNAADTLEQGEAYNQPLTPKNNPIAIDEPIVLNDSDKISDADVPEDLEQDTDELDSEVQDTFPLLKFICYALSCFAAVLFAILGVRYCITWFSALGQGDALLISLSLIGIGFAPFIFRFGLLGCKELLADHSEDEDEYH